MIIVALLLAANLGFVVGYLLREIRVATSDVRQRAVPTKEEAVTNKPLTRASFAEPMSPLEVATMNERERIDKLNQL